MDSIINKTLQYVSNINTYSINNIWTNLLLLIVHIIIHLTLKKAKSKGSTNQSFNLKIPLWKKSEKEKNESPEKKRKWPCWLIRFHIWVMLNHNVGVDADLRYLKLICNEIKTIYLGLIHSNKVRFPEKFKYKIRNLQHLVHQFIQTLKEVFKILKVLVKYVCKNSWSREKYLNSR